MARDPWPMPYYATFPPLSPEMSLFSERNEGAEREIRCEKPGELTDKTERVYFSLHKQMFV